MVIQHNMSSHNANRVLGNNTASFAKSMEKLANGSRIVRSSDDASGLAVSEKMRAQIEGLNQAVRNTQDGASFINVADGLASQTADVLRRMRELSVQAANGIYSDEDRAQIQVEISQLISEIDRNANQGQFNGMTLLTGDFAEGGERGGMLLHVGANTDQNMTMFLGDFRADALGITAQGAAAVSLSTQQGANTAIAVIDNALTTVNKQRADLGGYANRLEQLTRGQALTAENLTATESRIRDLNMADGMVDYTRDQILTQAGVSALAQANQMNSNVLRLLG